MTKHCFLRAITPKRTAARLFCPPLFTFAANRYTAAYSAARALHPAYLPVRLHKRPAPIYSTSDQHDCTSPQTSRDFFDHTTSRDRGGAGGLLASYCVSWLCRSPSRYRQIFCFFPHCLGLDGAQLDHQHQHQPRALTLTTATAAPPRPRASCMRTAVFWSCGARYPPIRVFL